MSPKDKARELVDKMLIGFQYFASKEISIQHALLCCDEVLSLHKKTTLETLEYWDEVKNEIEKL